MKPYSDEFIADLRAGGVIDIGAVAVYCDPPVFVWGGYGQIILDGDTYEGVGDKGLVTVTGGSLGGAAQNLELSLSGIDPETLAVFNVTSLRDVPVKVWRLGFDASGTKLRDASVFSRGRLDQIPRDDAADGTATLRAIVETAALGLGRASARRRSDADQRLVKSDDGSLKAVSYAGNKTLYWGGVPPAKASHALSGRQTANLAIMLGTRF